MLASNEMLKKTGQVGKILLRPKAREGEILTECGIFLVSRSHVKCSYNAKFALFFTGMWALHVSEAVGFEI